MRKEWFFDRFCGEQVAVYAEDGKIVEVCVESEKAGELTGNIYKGRVCNVVPGMQAAFVSCGMEKNCYLPLTERAARFSTYDGDGNAREALSLQEGDEILVQLVKPPRGSKGAKMTCDLSFVGKNLIYLPRTDFLGISRKITDPETREALLKEADKLRADGEGFIVRTAAESADRRHLKIESEYLRRVWRAVAKTAKAASVGEAVYRECGLHQKIMRDSLGGGVTRIYVGDGDLYEKVARLARLRADLGERKIVRYTGKGNMFRDYGLTRQICGLASPHVDLENGGYLVIDRAEAMTVIDVNTGKYTGENDLESTVFETNLVAAREIARQVRLRNLGGIIAVDFIDMTDAEHRAAVDAALEEALSTDRAKCRVIPMGELCVTMFTRKRTDQDISSFFFKPCPHCTRQGFVFSDVYMAVLIRSEIMEFFGNDYNAVVVELNRDVMKAILAGRYFSEEVRGPWREKRVYMIPHADWHEEHFTVRGDNAPVLTLPDGAQILY